jgi:hypothetical protein
MLIAQKSRGTPVTAVAIALLVIVVAAGAWYTMRGTDPDSPARVLASAPPSAAPVAGSGQAPTARAALPGAPVEPAPADDPARVFDLGFSGGLVIDASTVTALDRLQSLLGENPTPEDVARLENQLRQGLPREDADKAIRLLQGYRSYNQSMRTEVMEMGVPQTREAADALLTRIEAVQRRNFDPASADAMFADQNRLSKAVLDASLVQMDTSLTNAQKQQQLDAIKRTLPEAQQHAIPDQPAETASAPQ